MMKEIEVRYMTLKQLAEDDRFPFTIAQLRDYMIKPKSGLRKIAKRIGKKLIFREDEFIAWIESKSAFESNNVQMKTLFYPPVSDEEFNELFPSLKPRA